MNFDKDKIIKALLTIAAIFIVVIVMSKLVQSNSLTLQEYAQQNPELTGQNTDKNDDYENDSKDSSSEEASKSAADELTGNLQNEDTIQTISTLVGASLNGDTMEESRFSYTESFYREDLSEDLQEYITGVSFPANADELGLSADDLQYVHILCYGFDGKLAEGELICHEYIAQDLLEIFYELYRNEYRIGKVTLLETYDGNINAAWADNNSFCLGYTGETTKDNVSKHTLGLAVDINPLYNPVVGFDSEGNEAVTPAEAISYAERDKSFPYKITEADLCYKLFSEHGFTWGGNSNSEKAYMQFRKAIAK